MAAAWSDPDPGTIILPPLAARRLPLANGNGFGIEGAQTGRRVTFRASLSRD
jgi:hypothetical protein